MKNLDRISLRVLALLLVYAAYMTIFIRFFPNAYGGVGHDYVYWFPRMIAGAYWFMQNGWLSVPWFTPALNGGNLLFADPESIYFSFPQFLTFFCDPLTSITVTFAAFAVVGLGGMYVLLRNVFGCGFWAGLLGAVLFLFNGLFTYRMVVGHVPYHAFMLLPWILFWLLWRYDRHTRYQDLTCATGAALLLAYCFYAGGIHFLIPLTLSTIAVGLISSHLSVERGIGYIWRRIGLLLTITGMLCASKLIAAVNVIKNVPRDAYLLPGIPNLFDLFVVPIRSLFFSAISRQEANQTFENLQWALDRHEFQYGITVVPLVLLIAGIRRHFFRQSPRTCLPAWRYKQWLLFIATLLLLLVPIFANYYSPQWNAFLKTMPVIKNSSTLVRWYAMYIPIGILVPILIFEKSGWRPVVKGLLTVALIIMVVVVNVLHDKSFCYVNHYDYRPISQSFWAAKKQKRIPAIEYVGVSATVDTAARKITYEKDSLINIGVSHLLARSSLFGYQLEFFPQKNKLKIGSVKQTVEGRFNLINPSCYLYPDQNACRPGDRFRVDQIEQLTNFINYREFGFETPVSQRIANWISLTTVLASSLLLFIYLVYRIRLRLSRTEGMAAPAADGLTTQRN